MIQTDKINTLRQHISHWKQQGKSIALVPTMGNLHEGHLALLDKANKTADISIATIFVNPIQFDKPEDLAAYPRTLEIDAAKLQSRHCDLLFAPTTETMYGAKQGAKDSPTRVHASAISKPLEGQSRPGHFTGVATIVSKLFNLVQPDVAIFGEKDYQQLLVIRDLVKDLNYPIHIIGHPIVREPDGLAMSSRNGYLDAQERAIAPLLYTVLSELKQWIIQGKADYPELIRNAKEKLTQYGFKPDYIEIRQQYSLAKAQPNDRKLVIVASAWLGKARLIDNITFEKPES